MILNIQTATIKAKASFEEGDKFFHVTLERLGDLVYDGIFVKPKYIVDESSFKQYITNWQVSSDKQGYFQTENQYKKGIDIAEKYKNHEFKDIDSDLDDFMLNATFKKAMSIYNNRI